jgi:uncharacterized protein YuzE
MTFSYDNDADVLYVTFEDYTGRATYLENSNGDILRVHPESGKIIGCTILFFMKRAENGNISIPEIGVIPFNAVMADLMRERKREKPKEH